MSSVPRTRGRRFLRPTSKKSSKRVREPNNTSRYVAKEAVDSTQVLSNVFNALDHLGNQRFMLPPFSDHYERWLKDLQSLLNDFETQLPQVVDTSLRDEIAKNSNEIEEILSDRIKAESTQSFELTKLQQQLARYDSELSQLEHTHRTQTQNLRRQYEKNSQKIRDEITRLDRRRTQILRRNANIFRRLFRKSENSIAETGIALDSRRAQLKDDEQNLQNDLRKRDEEYTANRQRLIVEIDGLRQKIRNPANVSDDALDVRRQTCEHIHAAITVASARTQTNAESQLSNS